MVLEWAGQGYGRPSGHDASFGIDDKPLEGLIHSNHCVIRWDTTRNQVLWSRCKMLLALVRRWIDCKGLTITESKSVGSQGVPAWTVLESKLCIVS